MSNHSYRIHGINLSSNAELPGLRVSDSENFDIHLTVYPYSPDNVAQWPLKDSIYIGRYERSNGNLDDFIFYGFESHYVLSWKHTVDFHIAKDGSFIRCYPWKSVDWEQHVRPFVFGRALPFALNLKGVLTLHSSAVHLPSGAISFVADSGTGKSTLASYFSCKGHPFIADDVLAVRKMAHGYYAAFGSSQIRLNEQSLTFLNSQLSIPMVGEPDYDKTRLSLKGGKGADEYLPLQTVYLLNRGKKEDEEFEVEISSVPTREALPLLLANTTNITFYEMPHLREQFALISQLVQQVPVKRLTYGNHLERISEVYEAILADQSVPLQSAAN